MATIQHSALTDSDGLHEPKGVSTATSGDVYVATGTGTGAWSKLEGTEVASTGESANTYLAANGSGGNAFQTVQGTHIGSAGPIASGRVLVANGSGGAQWAVSPGANFGTIGLYNSAGTTVSSIGTTAKNLGVFDTIGPQTGITGSTGATGGLTISAAGVYEVSFVISFATVAAGDTGTYEFRLRVDDVEGTGSQNIGCKRYMSGTNDTGSAKFHGYLTLPLGTEKLTVWVESDDGSDTDDINVFDTTFTAILLEAS